MPDDKDIRWPEGPGADEAEESTVASAAEEASEPGGETWDAYRKWLSRRDRRSGRGTLDPALYTWKGYRNWAEEVKRNWSDRHRTDHEDS